MKRAVLAALAVILVFAGFSSLEAKDKKTQRPIFSRPNYEETYIDPPECGGSMMDLAPAAAVAAVDTYCVVWYDFDHMDWQGWTRSDNTAQPDTFFHIDDFAGLGGGDFGRLVPIEGTKSVWCGVRPGDDFYVCSWASPPGYGNRWDQDLISEPFTFTGQLTLTYHGVFDSEPDRDNVYVEYFSGGQWEWVASISGRLDTVATHAMISTAAATKLRFHFHSDHAVSDSDGRLDTDGACIIDSITVSDENGLIDFEDFEDADWDVYYALFSKHMTKFLPIAHKLQCPEV